MDPEDLPGVTGFLDALLAGPRDTYSVEFRLRHRDGYPVPVLPRGYVLRDPHGRALRISGTNTDLTERKPTSASTNWPTSTRSPACRTGAP